MPHAEEINATSSALSLSEPPWHVSLVFEIYLAELCLQIALFTPHNKIHGDAQDYESAQDTGAPVKSRPAEPKPQFSEIHWIVCKCVRSTPQQKFWRPIQSYPFRKLRSLGQA